MCLSGGEKTWREYLTLPNILKQFNPRLIGYAKKTMPTLGNTESLNIAKSGVADEDALKEAKFLVHRIRKNSKIDFYNDWKVSYIETF